MNNENLKGSDKVKEIFQNAENGFNWWVSGLSIKQWKFENKKKKLF